MQMSTNLNLEPPSSSQASMTGGHASSHASRNAHIVPLEVRPTTVSTSDHPLLLPENTTEESSAMMQHIMDLKLQLTDCLSSNDTLRHRNHILTRHNDQLIQEGSEMAADLEAAYAQITKLKRERDEAVRDLTRARMLQIRQDSSRRAKLLADKDEGSEKSGSAKSDDNSSGRLKKVPKASKSGTNSSKDTGNNKGGSWLSRLSIHIKPSTSANHDSLSPTPSSNNILEASSSSSRTAANTLQSISTSTRNLLNSSTLSFLTADLGSESLLDDPNKSNSNTSLLINNDVLPGRRSSIVMTSGSNSDFYNNNNSSVDSGDNDLCHSHRNTERTFRVFYPACPCRQLTTTPVCSASPTQRRGLTTTSSRIIVTGDTKTMTQATTKMTRMPKIQDHEKLFDATKEGKDIGAAETVALDPHRLPKRLSLNAREA